MKFLIRYSDNNNQYNKCYETKTNVSTDYSKLFYVYCDEGSFDYPTIKLFNSVTLHFFPIGFEDLLYKLKEPDKYILADNVTPLDYINVNVKLLDSIKNDLTTITIQPTSYFSTELSDDSFEHKMIQLFFTVSIDSIKITFTFNETPFIKNNDRLYMELHLESQNEMNHCIKIIDNLYQIINNQP